VCGAARAARRRIAFASGGTAGHVYPALAIAEAYRQTCGEVDVLFIGTPGGFEARLVPPRGYRLEIIRGAPLYGVDTCGKIWAAWHLGLGMVQARRLLRAMGVKLVIGLGGYASVGTLLAARYLGLHTAIHEANATPGLANRLLGRLVDRVYLGFGEAADAFPRGRALVTGTPLRGEIIAAGNARQGACRDTERPWRILVTGGSQGSPFLNRHVPDLLTRVGLDGVGLEIRHQVGNSAPEPVRAAYQAAKLSASVTPYIEDMAAAYGWADFVIACAGSGTVAELAVCGLPSLLVPLSAAAADHQAVNARAYAQASGVWWVREADWQTESLAAQLVSLFGDVMARQEAASRLRRLAIPQAAQRLVVDCEAMMAGQW
jgi:UDP-N-acetylglucosamine--N-acetylmuramyl-(pentapeptide) pyrophosphoryl-undecaprenol N-acetylglucosamine transferase